MSRAEQGKRFPTLCCCVIIPLHTHCPEFQTINFCDSIVTSSSKTDIGKVMQKQ